MIDMKMALRKLAYAVAGVVVVGLEGVFGPELFGQLGIEDPVATFGTALAMGGSALLMWWRSRKGDDDQGGTPPSALALALALSLGTVACAGALPLITTVLSVVTQASGVIDQIKTFADGHFDRMPNETLQERVDEAHARAEALLRTLERSARGSESLSRDEVDAAFADFADAYRSLLDLTRSLGVYEASEDSMGVHPDGSLAVPPPEELVQH